MEVSGSTSAASNVCQEIRSFLFCCIERLETEAFGRELGGESSSSCETTNCCDGRFCEKQLHLFLLVLLFLNRGEKKKSPLCGSQKNTVPVHLLFFFEK